MDVLVIGDSNIDIFVKAEKEPEQDKESHAEINYCAGGNAMNFALAASSFGLDTSLVTVFSTDAMGDFLSKEAVRFGLDISHSRHQEGKTGITIIRLLGSGKKSYLSDKGISSTIKSSDVTASVLRKAKLVYLGGYQHLPGLEEGMSEVMKGVRENDVRVALDLAWDETGRWLKAVEDLLPHVNIIFGNRKEYESLFSCTLEGAIESLQGYNQNMIIVVKKASEGSEAYHEGKVLRCAAKKVKAEDETGCGDTFNAGFIWAYLNDKDIKSCLSAGNLVGTSVVQKLGSCHGLPSREELQKI